MVIVSVGNNIVIISGIFLVAELVEIGLLWVRLPRLSLHLIRSY